MNIFTRIKNWFTEELGSPVDRLSVIKRGDNGYYVYANCGTDRIAAVSGPYKRAQDAKGVVTRMVNADDRYVRA